MSNIIISIAAIAALTAIAGYTIKRDRSLAGLPLSAVLLVTLLLELFDLLSLNSPANPLFWKKCALFAEALLPPLWILCSLTFARQQTPRKIGLLFKVLIASTLLFSVLPMIRPMGDFFYFPDFPVERLLFLSNAGFLFYLGIMVCLVVALVNFEVTLTDASPDAIWKIKFEIIGLCTILAVQVFYYSQAFLYRSLNMNFLPLRSFLYLFGASLIVYSFFTRRSNVRIEVSRQFAFKSLVLCAVGVYLVMLGIMGEGMRHLGVFFPFSVTVSLGFILGIALLLLMLSERFRRRIKTALHRNFYQNKHDYRTQWLSFTEQLSSSCSGDELLNHILRAYCDILGFTGAALFLYENNRSAYCVSSLHEIELQGDVVKTDNSLVVFMSKYACIISVVAKNLEITEKDSQFFKDSGVSFVVPLLGAERMEGFIVLGRPVNDKEMYIYEDFDLMQTIAKQASLAILHQRLSEQVTHVRQIEALGHVSTFVVHDLKNLVSNLSLMVENAARYLNNPDFQADMLASLGNTVTKMQKLINKLNKMGDQEQKIIKKRVNLLELAENTASLVPGSRVTVSGTTEIVQADENEIQKVILNLIMNGIEASDPKETLAIEVGHLDAPFIRVIDKGCGMSANFLRTALFKPFKSTKERGLGIGLYQCGHIVEAHGGRFEVTSVEGSGSVFTVWFSDKAGNPIA